MEGGMEGTWFISEMKRWGLVRVKKKEVKSSGMKPFFVVRTEPGWTPSDSQKETEEKVGRLLLVCQIAIGSIAPIEINDQ